MVQNQKTFTGSKGKGKGNPYMWVMNIKRGRILFTIEGDVRLNVIREACSKLLYKTSTYLKLVQTQKMFVGEKTEVIFKPADNRKRRIIR